MFASQNETVKKCIFRNLFLTYFCDTFCVLFNRHYLFLTNMLRLGAELAGRPAVPCSHTKLVVVVAQIGVGQLLVPRLLVGRGLAWHRAEAWLEWECHRRSASSTSYLTSSTLEWTRVCRMSSGTPWSAWRGSRSPRRASILSISSDGYSSTL